MKRYILGLLIVLILFTGCENNTIENETTNEASNEASDEAADEASNETKNGTDAENMNGNTTTKENENTPTLDTDEANLDSDEAPFDTDTPYEDSKMTITNSVIQEEILNGTSKYNEEEISFLNEFMGRWTFEEEENVIMDLNNNVQWIGVDNGQLLTRGEFSVSEINLEDQFIILHIFSENMDYQLEESIEIQEIYSKLFLQNNGEELLYIHDYLDMQNESKWKRGHPN